MFLLATDVQKIIMEFLEPHEIKELYETCKDSKIMFEELTTHTNFIIDCKTHILNKNIKWFELKKIKFKLLEEYYISCENKLWYKNGKAHRDNDLPAVIWKDGAQFWFQNGKCHRDNDLPAIIYSNENKYWYKDGNIHRDNDLPAIIYAVNGNQYWYKDGNIHRDNDLPAIITSDGDQYWYQNGLRHRNNDLPAITSENGNLFWYKNGICYIP